MKVVNNKLIAFVILLLSIMVIIWIWDANDEIWQTIKQVSWWNTVPLFLLIFLFFIAQGLINRSLLKAFNVDLSFMEWFGLSVVNSFWNYLPFQGGLVAKGLYLKKKYQFAYTDYLAVISASYLITFITFGVVGTGALLFSLYFYQTFSLIPLLVYLGLIVAPLFVVFVVNYIKKPNWLPHSFYQIKERIKIIFQKKQFFILVLINCIIIGLFSLRLIVAAWAIGYVIEPFFFVIAAPVVFLAVFTSITPGGLIIGEMFIGIFAVWLSVNIEEAVATAILDRAALMIFIFIFGILFNYYISHHLVYKKDKQILN